MSNEKRMMIAFALCVVYFTVVGLWQASHVKPHPQTAAPVKSSPAVRGGPPAQGTPTAAPSKPPAPVQLPVVEGSQAQDIVVENDLYKITFSTQGGVAKSWILRKYHDAHGQPLDVVNAAACGQMGYPLSLVMTDSAVASKLNQAIYVAKPSATNLRSPATLEFDYSDRKEQIRKKFTFGSSYEIHAQVSVFDGQHHLPVEIAWPGGLGDPSVGIPMEEAASQAFYDSGGGVKTVAESKVKEKQSVGGPWSFAGLEDRYFAGVFFPGSPEQEFHFERIAWQPKDWKEKEPPAALVAALGSAQPSPLDFRLFVAPKDLDVLQATHPPTDSLVNFGWFSVVAKPLFYALRYVHDHWVHNYGWAIVILTFILNMAFFPLKIRQIRSAQEMQKIAPLVKAVQDRYKQYKFNDPRKQRMNQEMMKLYQEHHINPLGGCLAYLPQLPILWGFYESLEAPFAFRHAPWILWIRDLSQPDPSRLLGLPIPILPALMALIMFIMQKMTPMPVTDPAQQRMMTIMPLFMAFLFFRLPSGLILYILAASVVGILQQLIISRYFTPKASPPAAHPKPAAA